LDPLETFAGRGERYEKCFFTTQALKAQNLKFGLECQRLDYQDFVFGFAYIVPGSKSALETPLVACFKEAFCGEVRFK